MSFPSPAVSPSGEHDTANVVVTKTRTGSEKQFETERCFELFGFYVGDRVKTPKGPAWVVGVHNGQLYFHIDGDKGASKWKDCTKKEFQERDFKVLYSPARVMEQQRSYRAPDLRSLVNNGQFSDVQFLLDDGRFVHGIKGILCKRSEYFRALFKPGQTKEADSDEVRIEGVSYDTFLDVLEYIYTGEVQIVQETSIDLVKAADLFMLDSLKMHVGAFLTNHITVDSVINLLKLADVRNLSKLKEQCKKFLLASLKDPTNCELKDKYKRFICAENADLVVELTMEQSNSAACSASPCPTGSSPLPAPANAHANIPVLTTSSGPRVTFPSAMLQYYQSMLGLPPVAGHPQTSSSSRPSFGSAGPTGGTKRGHGSISSSTTSSNAASSSAASRVTSTGNSSSNFLRSFSSLSSTHSSSAFPSSAQNIVGLDSPGPSDTTRSLLGAATSGLAVPPFPNSDATSSSSSSSDPPSVSGALSAAKRTRHKP